MREIKSDCNAQNKTNSMAFRLRYYVRRTSIGICQTTHNTGDYDVLDFFSGII